MRRWLKLGAIVAVAAIGILIAVAVILQPRAIPLQEGPPPVASSDVVARGAYLARVGDCTACHTAPGGKPFAGGRALQTPFGTIISTNITPDRATGIGGWSEAAFARALRQGVARDGHMLYSAMPYTAYTRVSDADIHALKAYFDTVAPVRNRVDANQLPFPFRIRQLMLSWNLLFFRDGRYVPDRARSTTWNRGRYLVDGLGHCAACHSAKNLLGGDRAYLQGGVLEGWYAPELSANPYLGLGSWSRDDLVSYLATGANARTVAAGPMAEAVEHSTQYIANADLQAMSEYILSLEGSDRAPPPPLASTDPRMRRGQALYDVQCAACHGSDGQGVPAMVPAFARSPTVQAPKTVNLLRTILDGGSAATTHANPTGARMPGFAWKLNDEEVADVATYIRNAWENAAAPIHRHDVAKARHR